MGWREVHQRNLEEEGMPVFHAPDGSLRVGTEEEAKAAEKEKQRQQEQAAQRIADHLGRNQMGGTVTTDGTNRSSHWS